MMWIFDSGFIAPTRQRGQKGQNRTYYASDVLIALYSSKTSVYIFLGKDGGPRKEFRRIAQRAKEKIAVVSS